MIEQQILVWCMWGFSFPSLMMYQLVIEMLRRVKTSWTSVGLVTNNIEEKKINDRTFMIG
jgi:hypothetical protein